MLYLFLFLLPLVSCQETTEDPHHTVTYNPGQDCLPYDGSVVPDCAKFIDPITKQPYYHEHSSSELLKWLFNYLIFLRLQQVLGVWSRRGDLSVRVCTMSDRD